MLEPLIITLQVSRGDTPILFIPVNIGTPYVSWKVPPGMGIMSSDLKYELMGLHLAVDVKRLDNGEP
jgi:hypothetical protein